ncbi:LOW QUALITY PROTEIN: hypothetical protein GQ55_1G227500 [Panicum hallii var. hallii]|uniref:Germin-like protein n=1 Tax=Panicum hallii var. hallii TaxID=1504633 RepID=A0A2T7F6M5_9POAL|nr:LOW QUALITY PROTEIN: hypothetical protein GQ55_1G227500 [Panicum hallii var. hallii]
MAVRVFLLAAALLAVSCFHATASDTSLLQDFCVVDKLRVNGFPCKDANDVVAEDFFFSDLHMAGGNTTNKQGSAVTPVNVAQIAGLNTMGITLARMDYAPFGQNPPHTHPRGTEILTVLEGSLYVGFVTSNPDNKLLAKVLNKGDVFVFPEGLIHFQFNYGTKNAVALAALSSQNPGAFNVDKMTVDRIQGQF